MRSVKPAQIYILYDMYDKSYTPKNERMSPQEASEVLRKPQTWKIIRKDRGLGRMRCNIKCLFLALRTDLTKMTVLPCNSAPFKHKFARFV